MSSNFIRKLKLSEDTRGMVLLTSLLVFMILTFVAISLADLAIAQHGRTTRNVSVSNSLLTAEAGIEQAMFEINQDSNFAGTAETEFYNDETKGRGTYQISVTEGTGTNEDERQSEDHDGDAALSRLVQIDSGILGDR